MARLPIAVATSLGLVAALAGPALATSSPTGPAGAGAATSAAASAALSGDRANPVAAELQAALDEVVAAGASGVTLRVDDGRRTYRLASGKARLDPPQPMYPHARIRVGSITKTFVSTLVLQLVGEGRLGLDDSVERWKPGLIPDGERITVRQLLNHTSGIFNYTADEGFIEEALAHPTRHVTPQYLISIANAHPPLFEPGTGWSYSNTGYIVLGLILERVTHRPVEQLIDQRIVRPLQLRDTFLPKRSSRIPGYHAHGYVPPAATGAGYEDWTRFSSTWAWAAGALVSNVDDLRRFYQALLGGRLLAPAQLAQMKGTVPTGAGIDYGLGLYQFPTECGTLWGHDGGIPGYVTLAWHDESGRRGLTIGLPTEPVGEIGAAFDRLIAVAVCRTLGQEPPAASAATTAGATDRADTTEGADTAGTADRFRGVDRRTGGLVR